MRTQNHIFRLTAVVTATGLVFAQALPPRAAAQGLPPAAAFGAQDQQAGDPPARVGRLARVSGTVSSRTQDDSQWNPAAVNYPVTAGNAFWTEPNAQADIEVSGSRVSMAPGTELDVATLNDTAFQATVPQGEIYLRARNAAPGETYAVQTPRGLVTLAAPGRYAVAAGDTQTPTAVTVVEGAAQVAGPDLSLQVGPNQTATITGTDRFQGEVGPAQRDPFLSAMLDRERPPQPQQIAPPAVVAEMPGGDDLAEYGSWAENPEYGQVWYPQVAPDWVPYRDGRWDYVGPWGWTWVDSEPWGFAPFHYGRWAQIGGRWGWYPGSDRRHVYAPALVTFFGVGAVGIGIGAAMAAGRIGWLPLGPREAYHPWYRSSDRYQRQVNVGHVTNVTTINRNVTINNFANRGAATVVPTSAMTGSRPVRPLAQQVGPAQFAQARPVIGQQPLRPTLATAGVTPVVARQLSLAPAPGATFQRPASPGPAIRAAGLAPGGFAGGGGRPSLPPLQNPAQPVVPAAAGLRPFNAQPPLAAPGARPVAPAPSLAAPAPGAIAPRVGGPAFSGPAAQQALPALRAPGAPGQPGPAQFQHQPGSIGPATGAQPFAPPQTVQQGHVAPAAIGRPMPQLANPTAPQGLQPQFHAPASPQVFRPAAPAAPAPQAPAFHPAPPPAVHAAPAAPPPAFHPAPPPAAAFHPPPQVQAPPPQVHVAAPPPQFHPPPQVQAPPPQPRPAPPPPVHVAAPAPAPAPHPAAPPPQRQKKPGEP
jgi:hypothetical protein